MSIVTPLGVCGCDLCSARRAAREDATRRGESAESWSHADMADFYPRLFAAARSHAKRDDLWLYSELQWDNMLDAEAVDASRQTDYDAGRRWPSLADRIARREMNGRHDGV